MNCPFCQKNLSRRLGDLHCECECGSILILPHGVAFNGSNAIGGGVAIAEAIECVGDAMKTLGAVLKSGGNRGGGIGLVIELRRTGACRQYEVRREAPALAA